MAKDPKKKERNEQKSNFMKDVRVELKKVTWPTRKELVTSTGTVLLITIVIAVIVFALDFAFEKANTYGVEKLKTVVSSSAEENNDSEVVVPEENSNATEENSTPEVTTPENETTPEAQPTTEGQTEENVQTEEVAQ